MRRKRGFFGDGTAGFAADGRSGAAVGRFGAGVFDVRHDNVGGGGDFTVFQFGQAGGIIENGGSIDGFGSGGVGRALRGYGLGAEMVARCEDGLDGKDGSQKSGNGFQRCFHVHHNSVNARAVFRE